MHSIVHSWLEGYVMVNVSPAVSAHGHTAEHPGPLDVDGGDGPDDGHGWDGSQQTIYLGTGYSCEWSAVIEIDEEDGEHEENHETSNAQTQYHEVGASA